MNNIIEVAKNFDEIQASQNIKCPLCGKKQFALFDKLFTSAYDKCIDCTPAEDLDALSENIFALL